MFPKAGELFCSPEEYKEMCTITVSIVVVAIDVVVVANDAAVVASVCKKIVHYIQCCGSGSVSF